MIDLTSLSASMNTAVRYLKHETKIKLKASKQQEFKLTEGDQRIVAELKNKGVVVIPNFVNEAFCATAISEIEKHLSEQSGFVQKKSDYRLFGIDRVSPFLNRFGADSRLLALANVINAVPTQNAFTLGAKLPYSQVNLGSGEGWHRDAFFFQFKAILYLTDVDENTGPFQWIRDSHRLMDIIRDTLRFKFGFWQSRFSSAEIDKLTETEKERLVTSTAKAGTLILANTSCIHRGKPIESGCRYVLTNYYFPIDRPAEELNEHFKPIKKQ